MEYREVEKLAEIVKSTPDELKEKEEYNAKKSMLLQMFGEPVSPDVFYYELFPFMSFESDCTCGGEGKANGILKFQSEVPQFDDDGNAVIDEKTGLQKIEYRWKNVIVYDGHEEIRKYRDGNFVVMSPISYFGKRPTSHMSSKLYGFTYDIDSIDVLKLDALIFQSEATQKREALIPRPTYIVSSGHGVHLYYFLKEPIPLYSEIIEANLNDYKHATAKDILTSYTTYDPQQNRQGILQNFRMPGTASKLGKEYPVLAFRTGEKVDIDYLNSFVTDEKNKIDLSYRSASGYNLEYWKEKNPEWYERRIVKGIKKGTKGSKWHVNIALYNWWLREIKEKARAGHRYSCMRVLAAYAVKCDVRREQAIEDAKKLLGRMNELNRTADDVFTERDIYDAFRKMYSPAYNTFSRKVSEIISGIAIPPKKRNGRTRAEHVKLMNFVRDEIKGMKDKWQGRKSVEWRVQQWQKNNPDGTKKECQEVTGLSRPTIRKWWNEPPRKYETGLKLKGFTMKENEEKTQRGEMLTKWELEEKTQRGESSKKRAAEKRAEKKREEKAKKNKQQKELF